MMMIMITKMIIILWLWLPCLQYSCHYIICSCITSHMHNSFDSTTYFNPVNSIPCHFHLQKKMAFVPQRFKYRKNKNTKKNTKKVQVYTAVFFLQEKHQFICVVSQFRRPSCNMYNVWMSFCPEQQLINITSPRLHTYLFVSGLLPHWGPSFNHATVSSLLAEMFETLSKSWHLHQRCEL